jgi:hypothetical protein
LHAIATLAKLGAVGAGALTIAAAGDGQVFAAVIAGVFMLVNSLLTIFLTLRLSRRRDPPPSPPETPEPPAS